MIGSSTRKRSLSGRYLVISLLVVAVGLLGPAAATQLVCPPDCTMHEPAAAPPSCCDHSASRSAPSTDPCCEGILCLDAAASAADPAALSGSFENVCHELPGWRGEEIRLRSASPAKLSSGFDLKGPPIPVYIRTCVFLI